MKSTNIIITIVVLILIAGGSYALINNQGDEVMVKDKMMQDEIMKNEAMIKDKMMTASTSDTSMMKDDKMIAEKMMVKGGMYEVYSVEKLANAESGDVVLFFKADWCPTCKTVDTDINSNLSSIPKNLTILDVDYDTNPDLKKKYGVTYQHTFVQVDKDGKMIKKWSGGSTLNSITKEII